MSNNFDTLGGYLKNPQTYFDLYLAYKKAEKMGYLRGFQSSYTKPTPYRSLPPLSARLKRLERQVNRQKPELQEYRVNRSTASSAGVAVNDFDVTEDLIGHASFRDRISGDRWINKQLRVTLDGASNALSKVRIVIYSPTRASSVFIPPTGFEFTQHPDHTAYRVFADRTFVKPHSTAFLTAKLVASLRNFETLYNTDGTTEDRNTIRVCLIWRSTTTDFLRQSYSLMYTDK